MTTHRTTLERKSDLEMVVTRRFDAPARVVFEAWTRPEHLRRWWAPRSMGASLVGCEVDARTGGRYRFEFGAAGGQTMVFFGRYLEVIANARLVWTNEESADGAVTTVSFEEQRDGTTLLVWHERYPTKEALDRAIGMDEVMAEQFGQLDELLASLGASEASS